MQEANYRFNGGLILDGRKSLSNQQPLQQADAPDVVTIPLHQHIGSEPDVIVSVGDHVKKGQMLANSDAYLTASVHASISGEVLAIEESAVPHPSGLLAMCVIIKSDGKDEWHEQLPKPINDYKTHEPIEIRQHIRNMGIVGLGGAAFPTAIKLNPPATKPVDTLIINGIECEPYITCDDLTMRSHAVEMLKGIEIMHHLVGTQKCIIAIEDNKPEAIEIVSAALAANPIHNTSIIKVPTRYPTGGEKQLIKVVTGKEVPSKCIPADIGIVCQNVGTAYAVYQAIIEGYPLIDRIVTLTGEGLQAPGNIRARIGTPISTLIAMAQGFKGNVGKLIMGGPMMGYTLPSDKLPIIKSTNCILAMPAEDVQIPDPMPCIRCGECADACPANLLPQQLYWHSRSRDFEKTEEYNLFDCIECGCCSYVCPSNIPLVQYYRFAKTEIAQKRRTDAKADTARDRHDFRLERLEIKKQEKAAKAAERKAALAKKQEAAGNADAIKEAAERAAQKKAQREAEKEKS